MGAREEGIARGGEMMSRMREEIEGMRAKLFEWNRFANLRLTHGENTMYLDAMFCAEVFGLIKTEMEAIEERMGDGGGRPAKARKLSSSGSPGSAASDAAEGAPVCHLDLAAIGLSAERADVVWDVIAFIYITMKTAISGRSSVQRQNVMDILKRKYPVVKGEVDDRQRAELLHAARWLDAKSLLQLFEEDAYVHISSCVCADSAFDANRLGHRLFAESVALSHEFGFSRAWEAILDTIVHFKGKHNGMKKGFILGLLTDERSPASTRLSTDAKLELTLAFLKDP